MATETGSVLSGNPNENNSMAPNLTARAMRVAMENKGLLSAAGSMYYGTGNKNNVIINSGDDSVEYEIPETAAVPAPSGGDGTYILKCVVSNGTVTVKWVKQ